LTGLAVVSAIVGLFLWPFVFEALGGLLLLIAAQRTADPRVTRPAIVLIAVLAMLGATFAVVFNHALY
jgi:hypothetical protein